MPGFRWWFSLIALAFFAGGCAVVSLGRDFPSPDARWIVAGKSDRWGLQSMFGEPYQVGLDNGDPMWRWLFIQRESGSAVSKDLVVRFTPEGLVKSYSFTSNFPDDLKRLK